VSFKKDVLLAATIEVPW
jgi:hypothetical protein